MASQMHWILCCTEESFLWDHDNKAKIDLPDSDWDLYDDTVPTMTMSFLF